MADAVVSRVLAQDADRSHLAVFEPPHASAVASWIREPREAHALAPRTPPPITPQVIIDWAAAGHQQFVLMSDCHPAPVGYGELNLLNDARREFWLGHLIIDPAFRGMGLGVRLTRLLLRRAFVDHAASCVSLVVFPDNAAAVACYRAAGLYPSGFEQHAFEAYGTRERLLRMSATELD